jgi:hypothetical protein
MKSGHGHLRASTALGASGDRRGGNRCGVFGDAKPGPGGEVDEDRRFRYL